MTPGYLSSSFIMWHVSGIYMSETDLPSRAKPESLHAVCLYIRSNGQQSKADLYESLSIDRRQIRASIEYGATLGFLTSDGKTVSVTQNGHTLGYTESIESETAKSLFRDAIEDYAPYRDALLWVKENRDTEQIKSDPCITQSAFSAAIKAITGKTYKNRVINLLIKTCVAAGLGTFITGRKGLETRLRLFDKYNKFVDYLSENYNIPTEADNTSNNQDSTVTGSTDDTSQSSTNKKPVSADGALKIQVEWNINEMTEEEIGSLVTKVRKLGGEFNVK